MTGTEINRLCTFLPSDDDNVLVDHYRRNDDYVNRDLGLDDHLLARFLRNYKDMGFGWNWARILARNDLPFPPTATSANDWLWRAYLYHRNKSKYRDETILRTASYITPGNAVQRHIIRALLITVNATPKSIAPLVNLPVEVVEAFQTLFFDIEGRRDDLMFTASVVYPKTRMVEMFRNYMENEALETVLLRAGYNHGPDYVLFLAGLRNSLSVESDSKETIAKLEALFMSNAYILAKSGWLNTNGPGLSHARTLMAAAKQGGQDTRDSPLTAADGAAMQGDIIALMQNEYVHRAREKERMKPVIDLLPGKNMS